MPRAPSLVLLVFAWCLAAPAIELSRSNRAWLALLTPAGAALAAAGMIVYANPADPWNRLDARLPFALTFPFRGGSSALRVVTAIALFTIGFGFVVAGLVGVVALLPL